MVRDLRAIINAVSQYEHMSYQTLAITMFVALTCGFIIYLMYRFFYRGITYSENFGVLIVMVTGTTAFIILTIGSNLVLSLGMVGSLSIVRFRAAIKEPLDIGFLFLAVSAGLAAGARLYIVALIGTVVLALMYILLSFLRREKRNFLLILRYNLSDEIDVEQLLSSLKYKLKNKSYSKDTVELTVEVYVKNNKTEFLSPFTNSEIINGAVLVEYNGDYT